MKILIAFLIVGCISCTYRAKETTTDRIKDSISAYLKKNLNDPSSYEPMSFDTLKTNYSIYQGNVESGSCLLGRLINQEIKYGKTKDVPCFKSISDSLEYFKLKKAYKPHIQGYFIRHRYRAKNAMGALMIYNTRFYIDSNYRITLAENEDY